MMFIMLCSRAFAASLFLLASLGAAPAGAQQNAPKPEGLGPTLGKIAESGIVYLAVREAATPFSYVLPDKVTPAGYSWELCQHVAKAIEARLGKPLAIVPVTTTASTRLMMVKSGMANIECGSTTNTASRQRLVAFSNTVYVSQIGILVHKDSGIKTVNDLNGKRVVTTSATNAERLVRQIALQRAMPVRQLIGRSNTESMELLESGKADAFVNDDAVVLGQRANARVPGDFVLLPAEMNLVEPYGLVVPRDDPEFKALVDATLVKLMNSGEIREIYERWFNQPIPPNGRSLDLPLSELNKTIFANPNDKPAN